MEYCDYFVGAAEAQLKRMDVIEQSKENQQCEEKRKRTKFVILII